jgi:hypothetical protein
MMQENDYTIKPVENLPNVGAMAPIDQHTEKRKRQGGRQGRRAPSSQQGPSDTQLDETDGQGESQTGSGSIDYRA